MMPTLEQLIPDQIASLELIGKMDKKISILRSKLAIAESLIDFEMQSEYEDRVKELQEGEE